MSTTATTHDELLDALALFDAYQSHDSVAVETLLSQGNPGDHIHSVLMISEMIAATLAATAKHDVDEVVEAVRRQLVFEREKNAA